MTVQDYLFVNDSGIRGIKATFDYDVDVSAYNFTIEYENETTQTTGTWAPATGTWADDVCTVTYVFSSALPAGRYRLTIEASTGGNEFNVGPYFFTVEEM